MKKVLILFVLIIVGCSVAPDKTTLSATTKATTDAIPTVKAVQTFKWSKIKNDK